MSDEDRKLNAAELKEALSEFVSLVRKGCLRGADSKYSFDGYSLAKSIVRFAENGGAIEFTDAPFTGKEDQ